MNSSTNRTECSVFETTPYVIVALVSAGSAIISALATTTVIFLILSLKKYIFFVQRLILYLCVAALLNSIAIAFRFQEAGDLRSQLEPDSGSLHTFCAASAFFQQVASWSTSIAFCCITFNLLLTTVFKKDTERCELVYAGLIFILPFIFNWIPFIQNTYGDAGAWCWIRSLDDDCNLILLGVYLRYILWYVPGGILLSAVIITYIFILVWVTRQKRRWVGNYDPLTERDKENLQKEAWPLMLYPFGFVLLNIVPVINRIYETVNEGNPSYALWILHAILSPLQGGYIALIYVLGKDTRKNLNCQRIRAALCHKDAMINEYPVNRGVTDSWSDKEAHEKTLVNEEKRIKPGLMTEYTRI